MLKKRPEVVETWMEQNEQVWFEPIRKFLEENNHSVSKYDLQSSIAFAISLDLSNLEDETQEIPFENLYVTGFSKLRCCDFNLKFEFDRGNVSLGIYTVNPEYSKMVEVSPKCPCQDLIVEELELEEVIFISDWLRVENTQLDWMLQVPNHQFMNTAQGLWVQSHFDFYRSKGFIDIAMSSHYGIIQNDSILLGDYDEEWDEECFHIDEEGLRNVLICNQSTLKNVFKHHFKDKWEGIFEKFKQENPNKFLTISQGRYRLMVSTKRQNINPDKKGFKASAIFKKLSA